VQRPDRQAVQAEDGAAPESPTSAARALELDFPVLDDDERVAPLGLVVGAGATGRKRDHPELERGRETSAEKGQPLTGVVFRVISSSSVSLASALAK
jgi:hypothetical protein